MGIGRPAAHISGDATTGNPEAEFEISRQSATAPKN
jgi:hypothetical protein